MCRSSIAAPPALRSPGQDRAGGRTASPGPSRVARARVSRGAVGLAHVEVVEPAALAAVVIPADVSAAVAAGVGANAPVVPPTPRMTVPAAVAPPVAVPVSVVVGWDAERGQGGSWLGGRGGGVEGARGAARGDQARGEGAEQQCFRSDHCNSFLWAAA